MTLTAPEWLTRRGGSLKVGSDGNTCFVMLAGTPQYALVPRPVGAIVGCFIKQTNSGKPIDSTATGPGPEEALTGGLEDLRKALGW